MPPAWVHGYPHVEDLALPKSLGSGNFIVAGGHPLDVGSQSSVAERRDREDARPTAAITVGAPSRADSHGKPDGPPDRTGPLRRLRSVNARAARCAVFMGPIVLTACHPAVLDPQGFIGFAEKMILIDSLVIMLAIVIPTIAARCHHALR